MPKHAPQPTAMRRPPQFDLTVLEPLESWRSALRQLAAQRRANLAAVGTTVTETQRATYIKLLKNAAEREQTAAKHFLEAFRANVEAEDA